MSDSRDVLSNDPIRAALSNDSHSFGPKIGSVVPTAGRCAGELAGEADRVNVGEPAVSAEAEDVRNARDSREAPREHFSASLVRFAEADGSHSSSLESNTESSDTCKEIKNPHTRSSTLSGSAMSASRSESPESR